MNLRSLQRSYDQQIMTPHQLHDWASRIPEQHSCSSEEYQRELAHLQGRFEKARTIPGTQQPHSFIALSLEKIETRNFLVSLMSKKQ